MVGLAARTRYPACGVTVASFPGPVSHVPTIRPCSRQACARAGSRKQAASQQRAAAPAASRRV